MSISFFFMKNAELYSKASYVKNSFELNIKDDKAREEWIGPKGKLKEALDEINKGRIRRIIDM